MSSLTTPSTHGSLPISDDHVSFPETATFVQNHLNVLAASCAAQLLETAGASFPPLMEGESFCFTPKKCSVKSSNPALFAPGQEFLCTNTSIQLWREKRASALRDEGTSFRRGLARQVKGDERGLPCSCYSSPLPGTIPIICSVSVPPS